MTQAENQEPIKIVGVVEGEIGRPRNDGTRGSALYRVPLRLSRRPSRVWAELFERTWDYPPQYTSSHRPGIGRVVGDQIVLDGTTIEEVEQCHLETLRYVLARVNEQTAQIEARERQAQDRRAQADQAHDQHVQEVAKRLRFD